MIRFWVAAAAEKKPSISRNGVDSVMKGLLKAFGLLFSAPLIFLPASGLPS